MNPLSQKIQSYITDRGLTKLEKYDKETAKRLLADNSDKVRQIVELKRQEIISLFQPRTWLTDAARRAKQISFVTHAPKFTHPDSKGSGLYQSAADTVDIRSYLSSAAIPTPEVDVVGNAAALDVANLLLLKTKGVRLLDCIIGGDTSPLEPFADSKQQLAEWFEGFKQVLETKNPSSHTLAKQVYFPVGDNAYHLLSPVFATSLRQHIYERITESRYSDQAIARRKDKRAGKQHNGNVEDFPKLAIQHFGGSKPQNISLLNSRRGGKSYLFPCQAPRWRRIRRPPTRHKRAFWRLYEQRAKGVLHELRSFLEQVRSPYTNFKIRHRRAMLVDQTINILLQTAAEIHLFPAGWSAISELPLPEQYWLDPRRSDPDFVAQRGSRDWITEISNAFALFLNRKLTSKKLKFADTEHKEWASLLSRELKGIHREDE